jgi:hypothetical protein
MTALTSKNILDIQNFSERSVLTHVTAKAAPENQKEKKTVKTPKKNQVARTEYPLPVYAAIEDVALAARQRLAKDFYRAPKAWSAANLDELMRRVKELKKKTGCTYFQAVLVVVDPGQRACIFEQFCGYEQNDLEKQEIKAARKTGRDADLGRVEERVHAMYHHLDQLDEDLGYPHTYAVQEVANA